MSYGFLLLGLGGLIIIFAFVLLLFRLIRHSSLKSLNLQVLSITIPKSDHEKADFLKEINLTEQLISSLLSLKQPFVFEVSVHESGEAIHFYTAVPRESLEFTKRQIQGLFLQARVEEVPDYTVFHETGSALAAYLTLDKKYFFPIRSYKEAEVDTFAPVASTLSKLSALGDGASLQIIVGQPHSAAKSNILHGLERLRKGEKLSDITSSKFITVKDVTSAFETEKKKEPNEKVVDDDGVRMLQAKVSKPLLSVNVRLVAASANRDRAEEIFLSLAGAFSQFGSPLRNSFKIVRPNNVRKLLYQYIFREYDPSQAMIMNTEEVASIFHLPTYTTDVPRIAWLNSKEAPPPENLPDAGVVLGASTFRGDDKLVRLADDDRRRHLYTVGQTGTGKSYFMLNMAVQDIEAGKGVCVIDPHGDLVDKILTRIPRERIDDVIVFDPGDLRRPLGLNMLEYNFERPEEKTFIVNEIQSIFNRLFDKETMGPMFEQYMRNSLLLLMEDAKNEPATLMEVPRIFTDPEYRNKKIARATNPTVIDFWTKEAVKTSGEQGLANMTPYITSKFGNFIANDYMRPIIGQPKSSFNFREVMDSKKILLVNLSKGRIGDINAGLLGMIITGRLLLAALSRVDIAESERQDFYLYIDEFQSFTTDSIAVILSEARKYKLNLTIAHQFIAQLTDQIREAVFGNVGSMVAFRVGATDAEPLVKQFGPTFNEKDLITIENQNALARLLVHGEPTKPFNFHTLSIEGGSNDVRDKLKELSRLTYGRDLAEVEQDILSRLRL